METDRRAFLSRSGRFAEAIPYYQAAVMKLAGVNIFGLKFSSVLAAAAAILWSRTAPGIVNQCCHHVVIMASLTTILFNANPLMRFDGYYILTDLLEIPNLYSRGARYVQGLARRDRLDQERLSVRRVLR